MRAADGPALQQIELTAGERFREVGMDDVADHDPMGLAHIEAYAAGGRGWVAVDDDDRPVGWIVVDIVDGCAHIEEVTVHPGAQGRGVGRALVERAARWGADTGRPAVTLTTFADVAWNRPLYEHLGFRVLDEAELGPELRAVREHEVEYGLDPAIRVCMRRDLPTPG